MVVLGVRNQSQENVVTSCGLMVTFYLCREWGDIR
jgi:hypothetical protein